MSKCVDCDVRPTRTPRALRCEACATLRRRAQAKARYAANPEKHRVQTAEWRAANPDAARASYRRWLRANREAERARHRRNYNRDPAYARGRAAAWAAANPGYSARRYSANPEAKKAREFRRKAAGPVDADTLKRALAMCDNTCSYCLQPCVLTVDHVVPIARGGTNDESNLLGACLRCNLAKHSKTPLEFVFNIPRLGAF